MASLFPHLAASAELRAASKGAVIGAAAAPDVNLPLAQASRKEDEDEGKDEDDVMLAQSNATPSSGGNHRSRVPPSPSDESREASGAPVGGGLLDRLLRSLCGCCFSDDAVRAAVVAPATSSSRMDDPTKPARGGTASVSAQRNGDGGRKMADTTGDEHAAHAKPGPVVKAATGGPKDGGGAHGAGARPGSIAMVGNV